MISPHVSLGNITLTATTTAGATRQYDLQPDQGVFVGSSSNCGLQLPGAGIADIHCRIGLEDGKLYVQNWMSAEGVCVNGTSMMAKTEVGLSDVIQIGEHKIVVEGPQQKNRSIPQASSEMETPHSDEEILLEDASDLYDDLSDATYSEEDAIQAIAEDLVQPAPECASEPVESENDDDSMQLDVDFFNFEDEEMYDRETVELLRAEIEELQTALAQRDAELQFDPALTGQESSDSEPQASDEVLQRMHELVDEANRSDERVAILEEMLTTSEAANRSEQEERHQLEAWVGDIEQRIGQREAEHAAEIESLRERLEKATQQQGRLQKQLQNAAFSGSAPKQYEETLENLQSQNKELQEKLAASEKQRLAGEQQLQQQASETDRTLREERATIAKERAKVSRLRFELSSKLSDIEELPKPENQADKESAQKIQTLREHLREIHEQEKQEEKEAPLTTRLKKLWKRVEY